MYDLLIKNAIVPIPLLQASSERQDDTQPAGSELQTDIFITDGVINRVGTDLQPGRGGILDACGQYVLPGLIDMHCHIGDPGHENKEDILSASQSAVRGGFTSLTCQPDTLPVIDNKTVVAYIQTQSRQSLVPIYTYGSMTLGGLGERISEIGEMINAGIVAVTNSGGCAEDAELLRNILQYTRMFDIPVITNCNDPRLAGDGVMNLGAVSNKLGLKGIPREAEEVIAARNIILAQYTQARLHIASVSTKGTVALIRQAKKQGMSITCETCPHYFTLTEDAADNYNTLAKTMPPLRTQADADALIEGLLDDTIDVISSGHTPDTVESVMTAFYKASCAISTLETAFASAYTALVATGIMPVYKLIEKMSANPAAILSIHSKGRIAAGYDADLFLVDPSRHTVVDASKFASKAKFSPYQGKSLACAVTGAVVGGRIVYAKDL